MSYPKWVLKQGWGESVAENVSGLIVSTSNLTKWEVFLLIQLAILSQTEWPSSIKIRFEMQKLLEVIVKSQLSLLKWLHGPPQLPQLRILEWLMYYEHSPVSSVHVFLVTVLNTSDIAIIYYSNEGGQLRRIHGPQTLIMDWICYLLSLVSSNWTQRITQRNIQ